MERDRLGMTEQDYKEMKDQHWRDVGAIVDDNRELRAGNKRMREALTPSEGTKATYIGEFSFPIKLTDEDGTEILHHVTVPWTTIKEIMAAIKSYAALDGKE